jgi:putative acetyltransferase
MPAECAISIRPEKATDTEAIRQVHRQAFGRAEEAQLVDNLREADLIKASLVALENDKIVGHILFSDFPIQTEKQTVNALALAPMGVLPDYQGKRIGSKLVKEGLDVCRQKGHHIVIVLGYPEFYGKFGFSAELTKSLDAPFAGESFMAVELTPGAMTGIKGSVKYPKPFDDL